MTQTWQWARRGLVLAPLVVALAGCSSGGGGSGSAPSPNSSLESAGSTVRSAMTSYRHGVSGCAKQTSPVVCLEATDRKLGNAIHTYANVLAVGHGFTAPQTELSATRDAAQTLANSLEILGDAQPTQANYDQVLNTFDVNAAITSLQSQVRKLARSLGQ